ncbi:MAG: hypothetical protein FK730_12870 [Asgard group archaeon]|nr:hypothetical protein [Asgard group archaeon]
MISLSKMKEWFENETENSVKKVRAEIRKRIEIVEQNLDELKIAAKDFEVGDTVDAETRSSQNIFEKMTEMVDEFEFPEKVTYKTAESFIKYLEKFLSRVFTLGKRFIPNLKKKYRTRVFILNRALTRIQKNFQELEKFIEDKTVLLKEVDSTTDNIEFLIDKVKERENIKREIQDMEEKEATLSKEIESLGKSTSNLEHSDILAKLDTINKSRKVINNKLKLELGGLDKPLKKLASRYKDGKVMVPPHLIELANNMKNNPLDALEKVQQGHQELNDLLEILVEALNKDKLKLKTSMINKATSLAENIMNGSLKELHDELLDLANQRADLEKKIDEYGLREKIHKIEEKQDNLEKEKDRKRRRMNDLKNNLKTINDEIVDLAAETQRNVRRLTNQNVKINIKE